MITILVVAEPDQADTLDRVAARKPSLELLHARDVEETLERLSRNRRIDAVLLLVAPDRAAEIAAVVREEDPGAPPLFAPAGSDEVTGVQSLPADSAEQLLASIVRALSS